LTARSRAFLSAVLPGCLAVVLGLGTALPAYAANEDVRAKAGNDGPLLIVISIGKQRLSVYRKGGLIETSTVSTGTGGHPTPTGIFSVIDKEERHYSNIYGRASMPFMQRLTMSGVALHSGMVTGHPASHGCIRLPHKFAIRLFRMTALGTRVIIAPDDPVPVAIEHPKLFVPKREASTPEHSSAQGGGDALASVVGPSVSGEGFSKVIASVAKGAATAEREAALRGQPISIFISKAEGKLFVRQGFAPVFEAPVVIRNTEHPIGTHVYTATEPTNDGAGMRWTAVSLASERRRTGSRTRSREEDESAAMPASGAAEALDRIEIPPDVSERISAIVSPGATLVISDYARSREMRAQGTDFIVLTP